MTDVTAQLQRSILSEDARHGRRRVIGWALAIIVSAAFWVAVIWGVVAIVHALG